MRKENSQKVLYQLPHLIRTFRQRKSSYAAASYRTEFYDGKVIIGVSLNWAELSVRKVMLCVRLLGVLARGQAPCSAEIWDLRAFASIEAGPSRCGVSLSRKSLLRLSQHRVANPSECRTTILHQDRLRITHKSAPRYALSQGSGSD